MVVEPPSGIPYDIPVSSSGVRSPEFRSYSKRRRLNVADVLKKPAGLDYAKAPDTGEVEVEVRAGARRGAGGRVVQQVAEADLVQVGERGELLGAGERLPRSQPATAAIVHCHRSATVSSIDPRPVRAATPWHLWAVAAVLLFLYAIGAYDYLQVQVQSGAYYQDQGYGPAQIGYFTDYPFVPLVLWTINIVGGLAAVFLLALRSRWAVLAASTAALSQLCLQIITFGFMDRWSILGPRLALTEEMSGLMYTPTVINPGVAHDDAPPRQPAAMRCHHQRPSAPAWWPSDSVPDVPVSAGGSRQR